MKWSESCPPGCTSYVPQVSKRRDILEDISTDQVVCPLFLHCEVKPSLYRLSPLRMPDFETRKR
jgi:hypothetical protein